MPRCYLHTVHDLAVAACAARGAEAALEEQLNDAEQQLVAAFEAHGATRLGVGLPAFGRARI